MFLKLYPKIDFLVYIVLFMWCSLCYALYMDIIWRPAIKHLKNRCMWITSGGVQKWCPKGKTDGQSNCAVKTMFKKN